MKKSITRNYLYNMSYQLLAIIIPIITTPYISRVLGSENIGIYSYTISIVMYFITFGTLGIALYGKREIAYLQKDENKRSKVFWEILIFRCITLIISTILFYFIFINKDNEYKIYYKILLIELISSAIDISWFFIGLEEFKKAVTRNFAIKVISVIAIFVFVKTKNDLIKYFLIYVLSNIVGNLTLWLYLPKMIKKVSFKEFNVLKHLKPTIELFIPQIAIEVYTLLDKTMIGAIINDKSEVGFYDQSQKIIKILLTIITSLGTVMMPRIASKFVDNKKEDIKRYMEKSFSIVFLLAFPLIFGLIAISKTFVPVFFGEGYEKVVILMQVISPIILFIGLSNVTGVQYLLATKKQKEYTISVILGAILNLILNSILIWKLGALGASIATVLAELLVTIVQLIFIKNEINIKILIKQSKNYIAASLIMFGCSILINNLRISNITNIILNIILSIVIYIIILILLKDEFLIELKNRILKNK